MRLRWAFIMLWAFESFKDLCFMVYLKFYPAQSIIEAIPDFYAYYLSAT